MDAFTAVTLAALLLAAVGIWATTKVNASVRALREDASRSRALQFAALLTPAVAAAADDPRQLLVWHPIVTAIRSLCPEESAAFDRAAGKRFPFDAGDIQDAHARWTASWLAWELNHDTTYKLKIAEVQAGMSVTASAVDRARFDAVEREKLAAYQRRYEDYARVSKGLQALGQPR